MTTEREQKLELDIAALRAEASILMDLVNEIPDDVLEKLDSGKLLRAFQAMSEADKHQTTQTNIDRLAAENDRLRDTVTRFRKWAVVTNNKDAIDVLAASAYATFGACDVGDRVQNSAPSDEPAD